jgi:hypothetical protein
MQFVSPTDSQSTSLLEVFDDEQQPALQALLIDYLQSQPGENAAFAVKRLSEKWPTSDDPIKGK